MAWKENTTVINGPKEKVTSPTILRRALVCEKILRIERPLISMIIVDHCIMICKSRSLAFSELASISSIYNNFVCL